MGTLISFYCVIAMETCQICVVPDVTRRLSSVKGKIGASPDYLFLIKDTLHNANASSKPKADFAEKYICHGVGQILIIS